MPLAIACHEMLRSHHSYVVRTRKRVISELNSPPACTLWRCYTKAVASFRVRLWAEVISYIFFVGLFHSQLQSGFIPALS